VVVDQQALAGALVCRQRSTPWAMFATTSAGVTNPLAALPKVRAWLDTQLTQLQEDAGVTPVEHPDRSPHCNIVFSSRLLVGDEADSLPATMHFVGSAASGRSDDHIEFPWDKLTDAPRILVSLGTVNQDRGERFYPTVCDAVAGKPVQVVLVAPEGAVPNPPDNVLVRSYVPQLSLLPQMNAVVSHGGHNTVCETLTHGLPLVLTPIKDDQPVVAQQVVDAGAGIRLRFGRLRAADLWDAMERVLTEPSFKSAAEQLSQSFQSAGGVRTAVHHLESLI